MTDRTRRRLLIGGTVLTAALIGTPAWLARRARGPGDGYLLSAFEDLPGNQYVGALALGTGQVFGAPVPVRAHGMAAHPLEPHRILYFARRPQTQGFEFDARTGTVRTVFTTSAGRHLAGHGLWSADGRIVYTAEHDYEHGRGVIGVRDAETWQVLGELESGGVDPHELLWYDDGRTLVVANGGILTHPRTFRRKLNIDTMDPSICLLDAASGRCLDQQRLPDHRLSIRHLDLAPDAAGAATTVAVGLQYEGPASHAPGIVALYRPGHLSLLELPVADAAKTQAYVASVAVSRAQGLVVAGCPLGLSAAAWRLDDGAYLGLSQLGETYGVSCDAAGTVLTSQRDGQAHWSARWPSAGAAARRIDVHAAMPLRWDDHWRYVPRLGIEAV